MSCVSDYDVYGDLYRANVQGELISQLFSARFCPQHNNSEGCVCDHCFLIEPTCPNPNTCRRRELEENALVQESEFIHSMDGDRKLEEWYELMSYGQAKKSNDADIQECVEDIDCVMGQITNGFANKVTPKCVVVQ